MVKKIKEENHEAVLIALTNWFNSQNIPREDGIIALSIFLGNVVGDSDTCCPKCLNDKLNDINGLIGETAFTVWRHALEEEKE